jgi:hypothetical protein
MNYGNRTDLDTYRMANFQILAGNEKSLRAAHLVDADYQHNKRGG